MIEKKSESYLALLQSKIIIEKFCIFNVLGKEPGGSKSERAKYLG